MQKQLDIIQETWQQIVRTLIRQQVLRSKVLKFEIESEINHRHLIGHILNMAQNLTNQVLENDVRLRFKTFNLDIPYFS